ncbi:hypothetical protein Fmac_016885 [Flemingia macrophylla]|uniref:Uncharacterized protein n=1 Tax=Flemingia macrophylla TaxID=520843 RepID=A0ABD1MJE5_9FABA
MFVWNCFSAISNRRPSFRTTSVLSNQPHPNFRNLTTHNRNSLFFFLVLRRFASATVPNSSTLNDPLQNQGGLKMNEHGSEDHVSEIGVVIRGVV